MSSIRESKLTVTHIPQWANYQSKKIYSTTNIVPHRRDRKLFYASYCRWIYEVLEAYLCYFYCIFQNKLQYFVNAGYSKYLFMYSLYLSIQVFVG